MKPIGKLLLLGAVTMFLLQSCVTVRHPRYYHYRRHCIVATSQTFDTAAFHSLAAVCQTTSEPDAYGNKE